MWCCCCGGPTPQLDVTAAVSKDEDTSSGQGHLQWCEFLLTLRPFPSPLTPAVFTCSLRLWFTWAGAFVVMGLQHGTWHAAQWQL